MDSLQSILIVLFFADMAIMLSVGGRLLLAAARNRRTPEAAIGTSAAFGALGVILSLVVTEVYQRDPDVFGLWALSRVVTALGVAALAVGNWRIYRPDQNWAAATAAAVCALAFAACAARTLPGTIAAPGDSSIGLLLANASSIAAYGWASVEAFRYFAQLRRRVRLGLADPLVVQQFKLWGISGACVFSASATSLFFTLVLDRSLTSSFLPFVAIQLALFVAAVCLWFAFYPPGFYRRRVVGDARG